MTNVRSLTALATLAIAFGFGGAAQADPFADTALDIQRVSPGTMDNGSLFSLWVVYDDGDDGRDATGMPDNDVWARSHFSTLGIDQNGTMDTSDDTGGVLVLEFNDNVCLADTGMDLDVYDVGNDESALVEVSYDGGQNFHSLGQATPGAYEVDADGVVPFFTQVRLTASDRSGATRGGRDFSAGIDVDAVECLNSIGAQGFAFDVDTCDMTSGDPGTDIDYVLVHSDGFTAYVELFFCGSVVDSRSQYAIHFASPDSVTMASGETTTTETEPYDWKHRWKHRKKIKEKRAKKQEHHAKKRAKAAEHLKKYAEKLKKHARDEKKYVKKQERYSKKQDHYAKKYEQNDDDDDDYDDDDYDDDYDNDDDVDDDDGGSSNGGGSSSDGACGMVPQHTVTYSDGVDSGGLVFVNDRRMSIEVTYAELNAFEADPMMLWVETSDGAGDNAPDTDDSDGCGSAETVDEAVSFTLQ